MNSGALIVQEDAWSEEVLIRSLQETGWQTYATQSMEEAWRLVQSGRIDALLINVFDASDGIGLIKRIQFARLPVRIVIASGYPEFAMRLMADRVGADAYLLMASGTDDFSSRLASLLTGPGAGAVEQQMYEVLGARGS